MTATDTEAALLAAIREKPGEDAPRLVYADWLEENAGTVQRCSGTHHHDGEKFPLISGGFAWDAHGVIHWANPKQSHHHCDEKCRVSDGRAELAAFVRVQVELAAEHSDCGAKGYGPCGERCEELRRRERELWPAVRGMFGSPDWVASISDPPSIHDLNMPTSRRQPLVLVSRGLPAVVRCTLAEWMGEPCSQCSGRGHRTLYGDGSGPWAKCQYSVDGRTPGIGPRLAQRWPVVAVEVTDIEDFGFDSDGLWLAANLPIAITERIPNYGIFPTDDGLSFADWLSDALIAWARSQPIGEGRS